ncbi:tyrosine-protein phosphatase [Levilactobacillus hammesii]|uniref:Protein tyrosine serine phosphatase n=1 Tax=Levilactobacillus hammesii DSM 16381 TaxID=1423753 RepID=A0A0R1UIZ7_9LACO|nr:tyrosine-protein phosphatase [Levilactobacillus hammesii]KRL93273.1 protein tyrosine serine phosphatase [Levilactobacillus hammesii DSM 16381]
MNKRISTLVTALLLTTTLGWQQPFATITANAKTTTQTTKKAKKVKKAKSTSTHIKLQGASNARDLGGYVNSKGQKIKAHRLIRSNGLSTLSKSDQKKLVKTYHVATDVDLRTVIEQKKSPDVKMKGVKLVKANVFKSFGAFPDFSKKGAADKMMEKSYHDAITTAQGRKAYKSLFHQLLKNPKNKAVLWHCSAGKDRAGMGTVLVLSALNFNKKAIAKDYLKSNTYLTQTNKENLKKQEAGWKAQGKTLTPTVVANFKAQNGVKMAYLNTMYKAVNTKYGNMDNFLHKGLGLTNTQLKQLRANYLTSAK